MQITLHATPPNNLPQPLTSFIGRQDDIAAISAALASTRLLTLTGVGGSGKTRLAREVASGLLAEYPDGIWWVDLAPLADGALVPQALATACNVAEKQSQELVTTLVATLAPTRTLLILDNCEHLVDACAQVAQTLLSACSRLTILATSREMLNMSGESVYTVPTLHVPEDQLLSDLERMGQSDAIRLFVERARAASSQFTLNMTTAPIVLRICRRLEGIPLAIELAAARVRVLALEEIAERLSAAIPLLAGGSRTALPRHQTLRATLDWSYALLSPAEARLLQRLAVFYGGFTLAAAEAVGADDSTDPTDVIDLLGHLVDKSLVSTQEVQGNGRYGLLEVIRQYAEEKLDDAGDANTVRVRRQVYFQELAEQAEHQLQSAAQLRWLDQLEADHDNIRASLRWAIDHDYIDAAARTASALWRFWLTRGYITEGLSWLHQILAGLPDATRARARVLHALSILTLHYDGYNSAITLNEEALALNRQLGDTFGIATSTLNAGILDHSHGDYARAVACFEQSLPLCSQIGYTHGAALSLSSMGLSTLHLGDLARARALCEESVSLSRTIGDTHGVAAALTNLGMALLASGHIEDAITRFEESLTIRRELGDKGGIAHTLLFLGRAALEQGDHTQADERFRETFALRSELRDIEGQAAALEGLAMVAAAAGAGKLAAQRFGAAEAVRERVSMPLPALDRSMHERWVMYARSLLGEDAFASAWAAGRTLTLRKAMDNVSDGVASATRVNATQATSAPQTTSAPTTTPDTITQRQLPELRVFVLGEIRVYLRGRLLAPSDWTYTKARELLFFLLAQGPASKEQIGLALWPDADQTQVRTQLHPALHHLRRAIGAQEWIVFERGKYRFNREMSYAYDVDAFNAHLSQARRDQQEAPERAAEHLESAIRIYRGEYLADGVYGAWSEPHRASLRRAWLDALATLGASRYTTGDFARAAESYRQLIEADPFQERAHCELMRCLAAIGERAQALRHYDSLVRLLENELGASPAPEATALAELLRRGNNS